VVLVNAQALGLHCMSFGPSFGPDPLLYPYTTPAAGMWAGTVWKRPDSPPGLANTPGHGNLQIENNEVITCVAMNQTEFNHLLSRIKALRPEQLRQLRQQVDKQLARPKKPATPASAKRTKPAQT
jgi:hypothetical protein